MYCCTISYLILNELIHLISCYIARLAFFCVISWSWSWLTFKRILCIYGAKKHAFIKLAKNRSRSKRAKHTHIHTIWGIFCDFNLRKEIAVTLHYVPKLKLTPSLHQICNMWHRGICNPAYGANMQANL